MCVLLLGPLLLSGCVGKTPSGSVVLGSSVRKPAIYYTCPMHHQIRASAPGKCPICGMTLIPVEPVSDQASMDIDSAAASKDSLVAVSAQSGAASMSGMSMEMIRLTAAQQQAAGIRSDTLRSGTAAQQGMVQTGWIRWDPSRVRVLSAWKGGWIRTMYVRHVGDRIYKGELLYTLYSPALLSAEKDYRETYRLALSQPSDPNAQQLLASLKIELQRWGLQEAQIRHLRQSAPGTSVGIYSPCNGWLIDKKAVDGSYLPEGAPILQLVQNRMLWVAARVDEALAGRLGPNTAFEVSVPGVSGAPLTAAWVSEDPITPSQSRYRWIYLSIGNPTGRIQAGMEARVLLNAPSAAGPVAVPRSALVYTGNKRYVWTDEGKGSFMRNPVQVVGEGTSGLQVQGLMPGQRIVVQGVYLLNSAYELTQGSASSMAGMDMGGKGTSAKH